MKGPTEKHFEGIYANPRLMHAVGLVVGCICHVQVKNGTIYEGVLKTLSSKADFVLEMAHRIDKKSNNPSASPLMTTVPCAEDIQGKMIFKIDDVVMMTCPNVDPEYATRESSFTDTGISKFNGQVVEKDLEPWEGGCAMDSLSDLGGGEEEANGWDPDDMFRTNEVKYGVKSSFDDNLPGYTIPLNKQNTEEYKQQEAKASKIAQEIESGFHHKNRAALENGDEEERFSAVVRPDNTNNNFRHVSYHRPRKPQNPRLRNSPAPPHMNRTQHSQVFHRVSSPNHYKGSSPMRPAPTQTPPRQTVHHAPQSVHYHQQVSVRASPPQPARTTPPVPPVVQEDLHKMNGEADNTEVKYVPKPPRSLNLQNSVNKEMRDAVANQQNLNKGVDRRKDMERKTTVQKAREEKTADFKRFQERFKLNEESNKDDKESPEMGKHHAEERKSPSTPESLKGSTLNPNAKEFIFNPNAKTFTPRGMPMAVPQPPRLHSQSPIMALPQPHLMPQTVFTPHYVVSGSMPFTPAASVTQAPRFREALPMTLQRHDLPQQVHVQAATGQPILAQPAPQFTIQYAPSAGMIHHPAGHPQQLAYAQLINTAGMNMASRSSSYPVLQVMNATSAAENHMYSLMPRVLTPQPVGMPTSAAYGENPQMPTHLYMHQPLPHHPGNGQQHSTPSTPQSQTPSSLHPAPSPVHQSPTPTSNNPATPVIYHPAMHPAGTAGQAFATAYQPGQHQQIVLVPQQPNFNHLHYSQAGPASVNHVLSHAPLTMIPTSAGMVHHAAAAAPAGMGGGHYVPHSQV